MFSSLIADDLVDNAIFGEMGELLEVGIKKGSSIITILIASSLIV